jgi:hypothetical protein
MLKSPRFYLLLFFLAQAGFATFFLQKEWRASRERCENAAILIREAHQLVDLASETRRDPFIALHANPTLLDPSIARYRESVRALLAKSWNFHLQKNDLVGFQRLRDSSEKLETTLEAILAISNQQAPEKCPLGKDNSRVPASYNPQPLQDWLSNNQDSVEQSRKLWQKDQETYCQMEKVHFTIFLAKQTMEERCQKGKKSSCRPEQFKKMESELAEVDHRLHMNRDKIRKKWGPNLAGRVICSSP